MKNGLYIVATPIGNLKDISERAAEVLKEAEIIACEDTRVTKKLFSLLGISLKKSFVPLHNYNEEEQSSKIIGLINEGKSIALVSDAGSPLISDPGYKLINECRKAGVYITTIPGSCALICALQLSGLPTNKFMFAGFIPNKEKARKDFLGEHKNINATLIFYETAPRILKSLEAAKEVFGNRDMSVVREITKLYEEAVTASADELIKIYSEKEPKGEIVFLVAPKTEDEKEEIDVERLLREEMKKSSLKDTVQIISSKYNLSKKEAYNLALKIKDEQ
ncbi:MAG: 16S rRNA (cytidine(1402)-2'-O)-methyltransferase [Lactobacillaceae bacterium]|jgi:16S rRNA (cytidine1402-2'-O)-methyltransferase|nr:16S rRNA (cytidine(1402)-2'-O)-methyltransferase [Lactobacillaceae bacterium]